MHSWYLDIFRELVESNVRFVVAGGVALNLLGVPRFTADLDLIVALDERNVLTFTDCMTRLGFIPRVPVQAKDFAVAENRERWRREKNMRVFSFTKPNNPLEVVDVFVYEPMPFEEMWERREAIPIENFSLPVVSVDHLIALKKEAGRLQDLSDIEALEKVKGEL
jgi:predicted nucleotidyltransferase